MHNLFQPRDVLALFGTALFLIFIYLVLKNGNTTGNILGKLITGINNSFKTLQGNAI